MDATALLLPILVASTHVPTALRTRPADVPGGAALTTGGLVWSHSVNGVFTTVELGDRGGQVLAPRGPAQLTLFSSFDADPPTPIWTLSHSLLRVWAASESDDYLMSDFRTRTNTSVGSLRKFTSRSADALWKFDFAQQFWSYPLADISRDGETIVSAFFDDTLGLEIRVHDPATGAALQPIVLPYPGGLTGMDLSPDGRAVVVARGGGLPQVHVVVDLATLPVVHTIPGTSPDDQALSDDGRVLTVYGGPDFSVNHVRVFVRGSGGYYQEALDVQTPLDLDPRDAAVSDDGSTVVAIWGRFGAQHESMVRAYDVATGAMTMERIQTAAAEIFPSDVAISADGSRFVVGLRQAGSAAHAELAVYRRDSSQPLAEHPLGGAVHGVDISPDGKRYAAARTPTNRGATSSSVELYELGGEDFVVRGRPSVGATVNFELHGAPGAHAVLLRSFALAPNPIDVPGVGTLHLDPASLASEPMGSVPPTGPASLAVTLHHVPGMIGRTLYYQGLTTQPRSLTHDWVQLTIVP